VRGASRRRGRARRHRNRHGRDLHRLSTADAGGHTGRLFDRLRHGFEDEEVVFDLDIDAGQDFPARLDGAVARDYFAASRTACGTGRRSSLPLPIGLGERSRSTGSISATRARTRSPR
jgi:hypothetical protein